MGLNSLNRCFLFWFCFLFVIFDIISFCSLWHHLNQIMNVFVTYYECICCIFDIFLIALIILWVLRFQTLHYCNIYLPHQMSSRLKGQVRCSILSKSTMPDFHTKDFPRCLIEPHSPFQT